MKKMNLVQGPGAGDFVTTGRPYTCIYGERVQIGYLLELSELGEKKAPGPNPETTQTQGMEWESRARESSPTARGLKHCLHLRWRKRPRLPFPPLACPPNCLQPF